MIACFDLNLFLCFELSCSKSKDANFHLNGFVVLCCAGLSPIFVVNGSLVGFDVDSLFVRYVNTYIVNSVSYYIRSVVRGS